MLKEQFFFCTYICSITSPVGDTLLLNHDEPRRRFLELYELIVHLL